MRGLIILLLAAALIEASFLSVIAQECPLDLTWSNFTTISIKCSDQSDHTMCCRYINALITVSVSLYSSQTGTLGVPLSLSETCETLISQTLISHNISAQSLSFCGLGSKIPVSYNSKSDIYSYGILLLELITSKPPLTNNNSLLDSVHQHQSEISALNAVYSLLDPTVRDTCESSELNALLEVITLCTKKEGRERPGMKQVVRLLYDRWDPVNYPVNREFDRAVEVEEGQYGNFGGNGRGVLQSSSSTSRSYCSRSRLLEGGSGCESPDSPRGVF